MKEFDEKETEIETGPEEEEEEEHKLTQEDLEELIEAKDVKAIREIFVTVPDIDIAEAADNLSSKDLIWVFRAVESKYTAGFFSELDQDAQENLVKAMTDKELIQVINEQSVDDVTDSVGEMPANLAARVLSAASKDMRDDINRLLRYKDQTAGAIMTTEYLEFKDTTYVDDAIETIRKRGKDAETIYTLFVKDKNRDFVGTVDLDDLIFAKKDQRLRDIMNQDVVSVTTSTDQEEVGQMFRRYDTFKQIDPDHIAYTVICVPSQYANYAAGTDVLAPDPYPVPRRPVDDVYRRFKEAKAAANKVDTALWAVGQAFGGQKYDQKGSWPRWPDAREFRAMSYLSLMAGAKGIIYYTYYDGSFDIRQAPDLLEAVQKFPAEIRDMVPFVLDGKGELLAEDADGVYAMAWTLGSERRLVAVNARDKAATVSLPFAGTRVLHGTPDGLKPSEGNVSLTLAPLERVVLAR